MPEKALATSPRIRELTQRLEKEPGSRAFLDLAKAYQAAGDPGGAARVCREGLARHPRYHSARVLLGKLLLETEQFAGAADELGRVVSEAPDNLLARRLLGEAQAGCGRRDLALATYRDLLRLQPSDDEILTRIRALEVAPEAPPAPAMPPPSEQVPEGPRRSAADTGVDTLIARPAPVEAAPSPDDGEAEILESDPAEVEAEIEPIDEEPGEDEALVEGESFVEDEELVEAETASGAIRATVAMETSFSAAGQTQAPGAGAGEDRTVALEAPAFESRAAAGVEDRPTRVLDRIDTGDLARPELVATAAAPVEALQARSTPDEARTIMMAAPIFAEEAPPSPAPGESASAEALPTPTLAELYLEQGLPREAEKVYAKLLEGDPGNAEIRERLARLRGGGPRPEGPARRRIRALEGWLDKIRRADHAQGRS